MQVVVETPVFLSEARAAGIDEAERADMVDTVAADPKRGDLIVATGGARKLRFAGRGKGKSGGYRVVYYFGGDNIPILCSTCSARATRPI